MPTRYTDYILKGANFTKFVMICARQFGALVHMRDESMDIDIPNEVKPSQYHAQQLIASEEALRLTYTFTNEYINTKIKNDYVASVNYWRKSRKERIDTRQKYLAVLKEVKKWIPPTADHVNLKNFMISQIMESIKFDCSYPLLKPKLKLITPSTWRRRVRKQLRKDIQYHQIEQEKANAQATDKTKWIVSLMDSLRNYEEIKSYTKEVLEYAK